MYTEQQLKATSKLSKSLEVLIDELQNITEDVDFASNMEEVTDAVNELELQSGTISTILKTYKSSN